MHSLIDPVLSHIHDRQFPPRCKIIMPKNDNGFTLIETLIATMVLAIGIVTIMQLFSGGLRSVSASERYTQALFYAKEKMNEILIVDSLAEGTEEGAFDDEYRWRSDIYAIVDETNNSIPLLTRFSVHVTVFWTQGARQKQVDLDSLLLAHLIPNEN